MAGIQVLAPDPAKATGGSLPGTAPMPVRRPGRASRKVLTGQASPNGWPINAGVNAGGGVWTRPIPGTGLQLDLLIGDVETILVHVIRRFHYELATLRPGELIGYRSPSGVAGHELNHASGTAVDIRPRLYPSGVSGGFFPAEVALLRDILADCEGVVRWGADFKTPQESHFQIAVGPDDPRVHAIASKIRLWNGDPAKGAGILYDPADPGRRAAAHRLAAQQAASPAG
jgi:hypothetical protein